MSNDFLNTTININSINRFSHEEIFENLNNENCEDFIKVFSIIEIKEIQNKNQALIFLNHLINHPNPIREALAYKLNEIFDEYKKYFKNDFSKEIILKAIIDINPNVSRSICSILERNKDYAISLEEKLIININILIKSLNKDEIEKNEKYHAKNKKIFSLYWFLEALSFCISGKNNPQVLEILQNTIKFNDYTIREKTAKIIAKYDYFDKELLKIAKSDQNFYVKNLVYDKINFED